MKRAEEEVLEKEHAPRRDALLMLMEPSYSWPPDVENVRMPLSSTHHRHCQPAEEGRHAWMNAEGSDMFREDELLVLQDMWGGSAPANLEKHCEEWISRSSSTHTPCT